MNKMSLRAIEKWINRIDRYTGNLYLSGYRITGDGSGDFEKYSDSTTERCLRDYIDDCEDQVAIAKNHEIES